MYKQKIILACLLLFTIAPAVPAQQADSVPEPQPATPAVVVETQCIASLQIRTNLLYWAAATPNLGMEWKPSNSLGILLNSAWSHWIWSGEGKHHRTWLVQPEIRYYFGSRDAQLCVSTTNGFFIGIEGHAAEFNFKFGDTGYQGNAVGGGITGGYRLQLGRDAMHCVSTFYLDFNLGLGYTQLRYDTYHRSNNVMVRKESGLKKNIFAPTQVGVSLIFKL